MRETVQTIEVLDHGFVSLVDFMGNDTSICDAARVSLASGESFNDQTPRTDEDNRKLIDYLVRHRHTSPLEQVEFKFIINCPIFVARQWMRHRTWSYNEISGRYTELPSSQMYEPSRGKINKRSKTIKQGRGKKVSQEEEEQFRETLRNTYALCRDSYSKFSDRDELNISREISRIVVPVGAYTRFYAKTDLNNLLKFLGLRIKNNAQYEIRVYAEAILKLIEPIVPYAVASWRNHYLDSRSFDSKEVSTLKNALVHYRDLLSKEIESSEEDINSISKLLKKLK